MLAGLAFGEMLSQYPQSALQGLSGVTRGGQQQFATQTTCVHLLGLEYRPKLGDTAGWRNQIRTESPREGARTGFRSFHRKAP